jgi:hypothetical protein
MSNYLAVAAITAAFGRIIANALQVVPNLSAAPELRIGRPPLDPAFVGANLFLYRATPSPARRNDDLATRSADGSVVRRPQAAIDLDYMLSFYGSELGLEPQRLLGSVVALLHANPLITAADVRAAVNGGGVHAALAGADLDRQMEPVRVTLNPLGLEDLNRVWTLFYSVPYAMSLAYTASTILLDADLPAVRAPLARVAHAAARPALPPAIDGIAPPVVVFGAGASLTVTGARFGDSAQVRIGALAAPTTARDGALVASLPPGLRAGVNALRVEIPEPAGGSSPLAQSPEALFVLQPHIADGAVFQPASAQAPRAVVIVNLAPMPALWQTVQLFLNPLPPPAPGAIAAGSATPLRFSIDAALAADLGRGAVTAALREAFAANGVALGDAASVAADGTDRWRIADDAQVCRLAREDDRIVVHHGLTADYADGTLAFAVDHLAPGDYLVSVQVGDQRVATSALRWGRPVFEQAAGAADSDAAAVLATVRAGLEANKLSLSSDAAAVQPMPGDGWEISDATRGTAYWAQWRSGTLAVFALDVDDSGFIGPLVTVPAGGS